MILGSGLGLYLCKNLCQLMGGEITVKSGNQGTKFTFYISENSEGISFVTYMGPVEEGDIQLNRTNVIIYIYIYIYIRNPYVAYIVIRIQRLSFHKIYILNITEKF